MMNKIHDSFTKNIFLKALSLCIAVVLWFVGVNIQNPIESSKFVQPLTITNKESIADNYIIVNEDDLESTNIQLEVEATGADLDELKRYESDIKLFIDLEPIDISQTSELGKPLKVRVNCELPTYLDASKYAIVDIEPNEVDIVLDKYVNKSFSTTPVVEGDPAEGYVSYPAATSPDRIIVSGAKTDIENIESVQVRVDISELNSVAVISAKPTVFDKEGNDISARVSLNPPIVQVTVPIDKYGKIQIADPVIVGALPNGYNISSIEVLPKEVEVVGSQEDVEKIRENGGIKLPPIDITGQTVTFSQTFQLSPFFEGTSLSIRSGAAVEAVVTVNIEHENTKVVEVPIQNLKIVGNDQPYEIANTSLTVTLKGYDDDLAKVNGNNLKGTVDLSGLDTGTYDLQVKFDLPEGVVLIGDIPLVEVAIMEGTQTPIPTITPTTEETPEAETNLVPKETSNPSATEVVPTLTPTPTPTQKSE